MDDEIAKYYTNKILALDSEVDNLKDLAIVYALMLYNIGELPEDDEMYKYCKDLITDMNTKKDKDRDHKVNLYLSSLNK